MNFASDDRHPLELYLEDRILGRHSPVSNLFGYFPGIGISLDTKSCGKTPILAANFRGIYYSMAILRKMIIEHLR